jgi:hypothetical protein
MTAPTPSSSACQRRLQQQQQQQQHEDLGVGSSHSPMERAVSGTPLSVVDTITSRSVTGRGMGINVHIHYSQHLHLVWKSAGYRKRAIGRAFLLDALDAQLLTKSLCTCGLTGVATCAYVANKATSHTRAPLCTHKTNDEGLVQCTCRVQSACLMANTKQKT